MNRCQRSSITRGNAHLLHGDFKGLLCEPATNAPQRRLQKRFLPGSYFGSLCIWLELVMPGKYFYGPRNLSRLDRFKGHHTRANRPASPLGNCFDHMPASFGRTFEAKLPAQRRPQLPAAVVHGGIAARAGSDITGVIGLF